VLDATTGAVDPFGTRSTLRIQNAVGGWRKIKVPPSPSVNGRSIWQEVASYLLAVSASIAERTACVAADILERGQAQTGCCFQIAQIVSIEPIWSGK
jgi:hypothetical protein